jgi:hypothetical protein
MFAQAIIVLLLLVGLFYAFWTIFLKDWLIDLGYIPKNRKTKYTERLDKTKQEYEDYKASTEAVKEESKLSGEIKKMDEIIEKTDEKIERDRE